MATSRLATRRGFPLLIVVALIDIAACTSFSGSDVPGAELDAGPGDALAEGELVPADTGGSETAMMVDAGGADLLKNGDYELGCAAWSGAGATLSDEDSIAHTGSHSCLVCGSGPAAFAIVQEVLRPPAVGEQFVAEAFLRAPGGDAAAASGLEIDEVVIDGQGRQGEHQPSTGPQLNVTWKRISTVLSVGLDGGQRLRLTVVSNSVGSCFLIDDARLFLK